jgi:hypothetical protein
MKKIVDNWQIEKIVMASGQVTGTDEYAKYLMCCEYKYKKDDEWTNWQYVGWTLPGVYPNTQYYIKTIKDRMYLMVECRDDVKRFEITPSVKRLLGI